MSTPADNDSGAMVILGDIHTGLLHHSTALGQSRCESILALGRSEGIRRFERPMPYVVSPDLLAGVDCRLATASGAKARGIGTVTSCAAITGGHVLQTSAVARLVQGGTGRRLAWAHYLSRPGRIELVGKAETLDLVRGFIDARTPATVLDLRSVGARMMDSLQLSPELDRAPPFLSTRTRLRWTAVIGRHPAESPLIRIENGHLSTLHLQCTDAQAPAIADFCADLALHDWLLTTLLNLMRRSGIGARATTTAVHDLRPAVDHLLHLWMPAARLHESVSMFWGYLDRQPGLGRQWRASVDRIRDQIALSTIALLSSGTVELTG